MWFVWILLIGLIIGSLARFIMPGKDAAGFILTAFLGVAGSVIATFLGQWLGFYAPGEPAGFIASVVGAVFLLAIYRMTWRDAGVKISKL